MDKPDCKRFKKTALSGAASLMAVAATLGQGHAETVTELEGQSPPLSAGDDVIVVKGTKLNSELDTTLLGEISVADTPFSVAVITADLIDNVQARRLADIIRRDPSVTVTTGVADFRNGQNIRGFEASDSFYDGLGPSPFTGILNTLNSFEQIEIIKGPSAGLLTPNSFGAIGGAINYVPKRPPNADDAFIETGGTYSQSDLFVGAVDVGGRLGDQKRLGYRLNGIFEDGTLEGNQVERDALGFDAVFDYQLTNDLTVDFGVHYLDVQVNAYVGQLALPLGLDVPEPPDADRQIAQSWGRVGDEILFGEAGFEWEPSSDFSLRGSFIAGTFKRRTLTGDGGDIATPDSPLYDDPSDYRVGDFVIGALGIGLTNDIINTALSGRYSWNAGVVENTTVVFGNYNSSNDNRAFDFGDDFISNLYDPIFVSEPLTQPPGESDYDRFFKNEVYGFGVGNTFSFDQFELLVGVRRVGIDQSGGSLTTGDTTFQLAQEKTVPVIAASYRPASSILLYANYGETFVQGSEAPDFAANAFERLGPLDVSQVEVGAKWEPKDDFALTLAVFEIDRSLEFLDTADNVFKQDGTQRHRGLELIASGAPSDQLRLLGGVAFLDAEIVEAGDIAINGSTPRAAPEFSASLFGEYALPLPGLFVNASFEYKSEQQIDIPNLRTIDGFARFDIGGRYEFSVNGTPIRVTANIQNVGDNNYWASYDAGLVVAEPRTFNIGFDILF